MDVSFGKSKLFYGIFIIQILFCLFLTLLPSFSLFKITIIADFLNGLFLPVIFFFLYKFSNNEDLMGKYKNGKLQNALLIGAGVVITLGALWGGIGEIIGM